MSRASKLLHYYSDTVVVVLSIVGPITSILYVALCEYTVSRRISFCWLLL